MTRTVLIGQAPGPNTDPNLPLFFLPKTSAGGRLLNMTGLGHLEYMKQFERMNLLYEFPGQHKRDDKFPLPLARAAAMAMAPLLSGRDVILVGRNVANAFGVKLEFHEWGDILVRRPCPVTKDRGRAQIAVVPHPSGRNHWYNKPGNREVSAAFWKNYISGK